MSEYGVDEDLDDEEEAGESLASRFEAVSNEHGEFERIPEAERLHPHADVCGILKVYSLLKHPQSWYMAAEHDIVYLADESDLNEITDTDVLYLARCGVFCDSETDSLAFFV